MIVGMHFDVALSHEAKYVTLLGKHLGPASSNRYLLVEFGASVAVVGVIVSIEGNRAVGEKAEKLAAVMQIHGVLPVVGVVVGVTVDVLIEGVIIAIIIKATAQAVILRQLPERWIVAQSSTVNPAISSLTPLFLVQLRVTGIVAAEEDVPSAVKYAGSIFPRSLKGFFLTIPPAMQYWNTRRKMWRRKITPMIEMKTFMTCITCPV